MKQKAKELKLQRRQADFDRMRSFVDSGKAKRLQSGGYHRPGSLNYGNR